MQESHNDQKEAIVMYGAGGHAKSVIAVLERGNKWDLVGLLDDDPSIDSVLGYPVIGGRGSARDLLESGITQVHVSVGDNAARSRVASEMVAMGFTLVSVVDPTAVQFERTSVGLGAFIHVNAFLGAECRIGDLAIISVHVTVGHDSTLGDCVQLTPGVELGGNVRIGDRALLGLGAVVLPGVTIGTDVVVGAGSVINEDVEDNAVVAGVPARPLR